MQRATPLERRLDAVAHLFLEDAPASGWVYPPQHPQAVEAGGPRRKTRTTTKRLGVSGYDTPRR